jgi:hypothetical protein
VLSSQQGNTISENGQLSGVAFPTEAWWQDEFYDISDIEFGSSFGEGNWTLFIVSGVLWILLAGGLVVLVLLSRKRTFARWLLPLAIGAVVLCTISTCVLGFMAFGSSPEIPDTTQRQPESPPTQVVPISITATLPAPASSIETEQVELTLINSLSGEVCYVFISPSGTEDWGEDWLGEEDTLPTGYSITFTLPAGTYDLQALDCDGNLLAADFDGELLADSEWTLIEE